MAGLSISNVEKSFGPSQVLKGVSLDIAHGEFIALVGPSGCGKSTLLRIIAGLERQDAGTISIGEELIDTQRASQRNLAMVFQSYALYPHLTVEENISVPLRMRRLNGWQRLPIIGQFMPGARAPHCHSSTGASDRRDTWPCRAAETKTGTAIGWTAPARRGGPRHGARATGLPA